VLARHAQAYAREFRVAEGRVRALVAYVILAGVLERATGVDAPGSSSRAERQARVLTTVMLHAGACVPRQY
jgi:hypothetical protein